MAGRIITYQMHPWECSKNYAALVAMGCNVDVQDLRRVLPPTLWMAPEDLEPVGEESQGETYTHGSYPQRYKGFSVGAQDTWGWLQHLGATEHAAHEAVVFTDWQQELCDILSAHPVDGGSEDLDHAISHAAHSAAFASFVDAHNTSYYINSYTTKVNPTMDGVLCKLLDGGRRLRDEWSDREAQQAAADSNSGNGDNQSGAATSGRRERFRRAMQVLSRFESCFRRASCKGGFENAFPDDLRTFVPHETQVQGGLHDEGNFLSCRILAPSLWTARHTVPQKPQLQRALHAHHGRNLRIGRVAQREPRG